MNRALPPRDRGTDRKAGIEHRRKCFAHIDEFNDLVDPIRARYPTLSVNSESNTCATKRVHADAIDSANFNGTAIPAGNYVWFNSHVKVTGPVPSGLTVNLSNSTITVPATNSSAVQNIVVPNSTITFSSGVSTTSATYDSIQNAWTITTPVNPLDDEILLSGVAFQSQAAACPAECKM